MYRDTVCLNLTVFDKFLSLWLVRGALKGSVFANTPFNPIPALGYLKSHVLCPNKTNDTSLGSSCALLLESAKKFANLQKLNFLSQNPVI